MFGVVFIRSESCFATNRRLRRHHMQVPGNTNSIQIGRAIMWEVKKGCKAVN